MFIAKIAKVLSSALNPAGDLDTDNKCFENVNGHHIHTKEVTKQNLYLWLFHINVKFCGQKFLQLIDRVKATMTYGLRSRLRNFMAYIKKYERSGQGNSE